ncbi:MAG TPA: response regulator [Rhodospirillales bacterium]|jgi:FixJ family two-component response regulator
MAKTKPTVFVVDDDAAVRSSLCWLISSLNWNVRAFPSAGDFLETVPPTDRGCAIVDVRMPGMSGLRLQREIRDHYPHVKTILMSAYGTREAAESALANGALGYLEKPINDDVLVDLLRKGIQSDNGNSNEPPLPF